MPGSDPLPKVRNKGQVDLNQYNMSNVLINNVTSLIRPSFTSHYIYITKQEDMTFIKLDYVYVL